MEMGHRILHISNFYWPHIGGIEDVCKTLVDHTEGMEVRVLCFADSKTDTIDCVDGIAVVRVGVWRRLWQQAIPYHYGRVLRRVLRDFRPDVVHLHLPNPLAMFYVLALLPRSVRLIVHWHSDIIVHRRLYRLVAIGERRVLGLASAVIATSHAYMESSLMLRRYRDKCVVMPNVISEEKLNLCAASGLTVEKIRQRYGEHIVLFVGRHVPYKGLDRLLEAVKLLRQPCKVLIGGSGPLTSRLQTIARSLPNVEFLGNIPDDELGVWMRASRVFAFPSVTRNEAFGVALAEAMYCGAVPVTFTIAGSGVNWVSLHEITGLEVANGDVRSFALSIDRLLADDTLYNRLSQAGRERVKSHFVPECVQETLRQLYVCKGKP
ncbi:glycosyltransferase [Prevotella sp.]|uniref:glycosyltransferase n=1 Tax=Prevotella sp. TaxID=59823 RepID=UPI002F92CD9C